MNDNIIVSVLCVAYNNEKNIKQAIESVLNQETEFKFEVIIHDDASSDKTALIVKKLEKSYPDIIKGIYQVDNMYSQNIRIMDKFMIPLAKGKYIAFCEGDDFWSDKKKLQKQVEFLENHLQYICCTHNSLVLDCKTGLKRKLNTTENSSGKIEINRLLEWPQKACFHSSSMLIRSEYLNYLHKFYYKIFSFSDFTLALSLALNGKIYFFSDIMSTYRLFVKGSWSYKANMINETMIEHRKDIIKIYQMFNKETNNQYKEEIQKCIDDQLYYIYSSQKKFFKVFMLKYCKLFKILFNNIKYSIYLKKYKRN